MVLGCLPPARTFHIRLIKAVRINLSSIRKHMIEGEGSKNAQNPLAQYLIPTKLDLELKEQDMS